MSDTYKLAKELSGNSFVYGGVEETIGFIIDNYPEAMRIYRIINKQVKEADLKRDEAHEKLQNLRADEDRWTQTKKFPPKYDAEEHQKRKDHLVELREKEYDILYNGCPLAHDKLSNLIVNHMWMFDLLDSIDLTVRGKLGPLASKVIAKALWPLMKMVEFTADNANSYSEEKFLRDHLKNLQSVPDILKEKFINP